MEEEKKDFNFSLKTKYRLFIDGMKADIIESVDEIFDFEKDPEITFDVFRSLLRRYKKENKKQYLKLLESDCEEPLEESEISKWRRLNNTN